MGLDPDTLRAELRALLQFADALRLRDGIDIFPRLFEPFISGIEVTQGIQYYRANLHLTNADDRGPDNSVRLAANKPAWVRVYVRSGVLGGSHDLTGELVVEHREGPFLMQWATVATQAPQPPGSVTTQASPSYATERSTLGSTLNFILGANLLRGMVRLTARVWRVGDATRTLVDTQQETVDATMLQTLSLRGIFIAYNGPDPTTNPPKSRRGSHSHRRPHAC